MTLHAGKLVFHVSLEHDLTPGAFPSWLTCRDRPVFNKSLTRMSKVVQRGFQDTAFLAMAILRKMGFRKKIGIAALPVWALLKLISVKDLSSCFI